MPLCSVINTRAALRCSSSQHTRHVRNYIIAQHRMSFCYLLSVLNIGSHQFLVNCTTLEQVMLAIINGSSPPPHTHTQICIKKLDRKWLAIAIVIQFNYISWKLQQNHESTDTKFWLTFKFLRLRIVSIRYSLYLYTTHTPFYQPFFRAYPIALVFPPPFIPILYILLGQA